MLIGISCLLVIFLVATTTAIRVDWNTNTGPILPPKPHTTRRPVPPFREPAPVWEDLSNDIPNPNPYVYVAPPPSRPKQTLYTNVNYNTNSQNNNINYGSLITDNSLNSYQQHTRPGQQVAALSPQYIPNIGTRYVAVVPNALKATATSATKYPAASAKALSPNDSGDGFKLQGKYNAKTKKYKAYEKVKYVPHNYLSLSKNSDTQLEASSKQRVLQEIPVWNDDNAADIPMAESWPQNSNKITEKITSTPNTIMASFSGSARSKSFSPIEPYKFYSKNVYVKDSSPKLKEKSKSNKTS